MAQLRQDYPDFVKRETEILIVSPEDAETVRGFWQDQKMPMVGLADPGHETAGQYGQEVSLIKLGRMPSLVILDRSGIVRFEHHAAHMAHFPENGHLLAVLDGLNTEWAGRPAENRMGA
jgi:peroxiredoxin